MRVIFIKEHPAGYELGAELNTTIQHAINLINKGYCAAAEGQEELLPKQEPEFIEVTLTKKMIKAGTYGELSDGKIPGDNIQVPNPNFVN